VGDLHVPMDAVRRVFIGDSAAGRAAAMLSTGAAGASFMPGLMPRRVRDQVLATGVMSALQYGLVITAQARHRTLARVVSNWTDRADDPLSQRAVAAAVAAGTAAAGYVVARALPQRPEEPLVRAGLRTLGIRASRLDAASLVVVAADAVDEQWGERSQIVRTVAPGIGLLAGAGAAAAYIRAFRRPDPVITARLQPVRDPLTGELAHPAQPGEGHRPSVPTSLLLGAVVSGTLHLGAGFEGLAARRIAARVARVVPGSGPYAHLVGHTVILGTLAAAIGVGVEYLYRREEAGGEAIDAAYTTAPTCPAVSGGPRSEIDWQTLSREGVRFVALALSREEIAAVTGVPADQVVDPVRGYAGLETNETIGGRVDTVMEDLERLGAFERSVLCLASPTGTGYVNPVFVETLEYLTRGDCATVALQYSLRPSYLSLDRVRMAREQNGALLHALAWRIRGLPVERRPRLVGFGESLGAQSLQDCFLHAGVKGFHMTGMDGALFLGTPAASLWARDWRLHGDAIDPDGEVTEVASYAEWLAAVEGRPTPPRFVMLSNHEDPITRFSLRLVVRRPDWLGPADSRPPGIPRYAAWLPWGTMLLTLVDVINAMDAVPGVFVARGHDYRASIARMVSAAYGMPVDEDEAGRIEHALRERERTWAQRRLAAKQATASTG
jgi:uncharacterized membrane protein